MIGTDAWYARKAQKFRSLNANDTVEYAILLVDENRMAKPEIADCGRYLSNMRRVDLAHIARRERKICGHTVDKLELRDDIVANRMVWPSRSRGEVRQLLPPMPAFHHESTLQ